MGLDITAYSQLKHIGWHPFESDQNEGEPGPWCYHEGHVQTFSYDCFPQSFRGIPILGTRRLQDGTGILEGGCYAITDGTETHDFRFSYGGYSAWRANLQEQFNPDRDPDGPFYELIWFADNEGSIGPEAARDLLADFTMHADRYTLPANWPNKFSDWIRAFELAADSGLVRFQ
jgi:hypothetical protein